MKKLTSYVLALLVAVLTGCAATGPKFSEHRDPQPNESRVYIYRPFSMISQMGGPELALDNKDLGKLMNKGYLAAYVPAGEHKISTSRNLMTWSAPNIEFSFSTEAGKTYYIRHLVSASGINYVSPTVISSSFSQELSLVEAETGRQEILECHMIE